MIRRRAVITGCGLVTARGDRDQTWAGLMRHESRVMRRFRHAEGAFPFGRSFCIDGFDAGGFVRNHSDRRAMGTAMHYAAASAGMAMEDAGLLQQPSLLQTAALLVGARFGERDEDLDFQVLATISKSEFVAHDYADALNSQLTRNLRPGLFLAQLPNLFAGNIALLFQLRGPSMTFVGEHGAGARAVLEGVDLVQDGSVDVAIVGGAFNAEDYQTRFAFAGSGMLSRDRTDSDLSPPRPWTPDADGVVLGSGAGFLVIEAAEHAERRNAVPYAEIAYVACQSGPRTLRGAAEWLTLEYRHWIESGGEAALAVIGNGLGVRTLDAEEMTFLAAAARAGSGGLALTTCSPCIGDVVHASMPVRLALAAIAVRRGELFPAGPAAAKCASHPEGVRVVTRSESRPLPSAMALSLGYEESESFAVLRRYTPDRRGS